MRTGPSPLSRNGTGCPAGYDGRSEYPVSRVCQDLAVASPLVWALDPAIYVAWPVSRTWTDAACAGNPSCSASAIVGTASDSKPRRLSSAIAIGFRNVSAVTPPRERAIPPVGRLL